MSAVRGRGRGLTRGWGEAGWRLDGGWMEAEDSSASIVSGGRRRTRQPSIGASELLVSDSIGGLDLLVSRVSFIVQRMGLSHHKQIHWCYLE